ncbi:acyl-CoA mutase large subunit family protein [Pseudaminobacter salicylatoxidans]|uniref:acyl-CoA mutase large subunit family protein n=1 Tax=Pseudaminobacter salicylatoxidans TaxID=93369 RepID=UPI0002E47A47|nr:methylmalonyl-CoA mutase family protein [Pseudaminobacter salicylatoxidans]
MAATRMPNAVLQADQDRSDPVSPQSTDRAAWERTTLASSLDRLPRRQESFTTLSGLPIADLYTPDDVKGIDPLKDIGFPGEYPYTRGVHATMHRARPWTIRQVAGFGTAEDTNGRYKYLLDHGETGLSTDFDLPTLLGRDSDHPMGLPEIGRIGVAVDTLEDVRRLMADIPLDQVSTSYTINASAFVLIGMYEAVAKDQGVADNLITGTCQNDILKEYTAQNEYIYPPRDAVRLVVDTMEYAAKTMPRYNPVSVSGYHIREAGATAVQELAFTLGAGHCYVTEAMKRGIPADQVAPRVSFFWDIHNDFFEEICKLRAARRLWARMMRDWVGARDPRSWLMRAHSQTAGVSLTAQQPDNNIARTAIQALAAILGGTQSLHTNSKDEAYQIPSEGAIKIAVRTQQILALENRVADIVDPLAGSYYVENLTTRLEEEAEALLRQVLDRGGMVESIEDGFIQRQIADSSAAYQQALDEKLEFMVGVNVHVDEDEELPFEHFELDPGMAERQIKRTQSIRRMRNQAETAAALKEVRAAAVNKENTMPAVSRAIRADATVGEICDVMREVYGEYSPPLVY